MSLELLKGWELLRIGDLCKPASMSVQVNDDEEYDLLGVRWYGNGCHSHSRTKGSELKTRVLNRVRASQIVYNKMWVSKGAFAVVPTDLDGAHATAEYPNFDIRLDRLDPDFIEHYMRQDTFKEDAILLCKGSTSRARLNPSDFLDMTIWLPPLHEQRRVAEILSSVDEAIAATRAVIEQTRKVKQSALGTLFHRGNWSDAGLPADHSLTRLEDIARRGSGHTPSKKFNEYWNGGIAWVSLQDTKALDRRYIDTTAANISELGINNSSAEVHPAGTVFVSRDATVGRVGVMRVPMAVSQHFISWTCGPMLDNVFLYYWLLNMKPVFERIAAGSTIKTIGLSFFKELEIALPAIATQKRIASQMMAIDDALDGNEASLAELAALKSALMSDLLTGRKRVTDALPMAAE